MFYSFYFQIFVAIELYLERSAVFKILENRSSSKSFRSIKLALFKMSRYKRLTVSINKFSFKGSMLRILAKNYSQNAWRSRFKNLMTYFLNQVFLKLTISWKYLPSAEWIEVSYDSEEISKTFLRSPLFTRVELLTFDFFFGWVFRLSVSALPHSSLIWAPITNSTASEKEE